MAEPAGITNETDRYVLGSLLADAEIGNDIAAAWRQLRSHLPHPLVFGTWAANALAVVFDIAADKGERIRTAELHLLLGAVPYHEFKDHLRVLEDLVKQEEKCKPNMVRTIIKGYKDLEVGAQDQNWGDSVLAHIGGFNAIMDLMKAGTAGITPERLAERLMTEHARRRLTMELDRSKRKAQEHELDMSAIISHLKQTVERLQPRNMHMLDVGEQMDLHRYDSEQQVRQFGKFTFGEQMHEIDEAMEGLEPGSMLFISAEPGGGKTCLMWQSAIETAMLNGNGSVHYYSFEMTRRQHDMRLKARLAQVSLNKVKKGEPNDNHKGILKRKCDAIRGTITLCDKTIGLLTVEQIVAGIERMKEERPALKFIYIDRLEKIKYSLSSYSKDLKQVEHILQELNAIGGKLGISFIIAAQMTREARKEMRNKEGRIDRVPEPRMADIIGGSAIESEASHILFIWRRDVEEKASTRVTFKAAKNRDSPKFKINGQFHGPTQSLSYVNTTYDD